MNKFYGVYGCNGIAVCDSWDCAKKQLRFMKKGNNKAFSQKEEAFEYALDKFNLLNADGFQVADNVTIESIKINWMYYKKDLVKLSEGGYVE